MKAYGLKWPTEDLWFKSFPKRTATLAGLWSSGATLSDWWRRGFKSRRASSLCPGANFQLSRPLFASALQAPNKFVLAYLGAEFRKPTYLAEAEYRLGSMVAFPAYPVNAQAVRADHLWSTCCPRRESALHFRPEIPWRGIVDRQPDRHWIIKGGTLFRFSLTHHVDLRQGFRCGRAYT